MLRHLPNVPFNLPAMEKGLMTKVFTYRPYQLADASDRHHTRPKKYKSIRMTLHAKMNKVKVIELY